MIRMYTSGCLTVHAMQLVDPLPASSTPLTASPLAALLGPIQSAQREMALWFLPHELADYEFANKAWIYE